MIKTHFRKKISKQTQNTRKKELKCQKTLGKDNVEV